MFFFGGGKCPNLGVVNVRILGVVNVRLANNLTPSKIGTVGKSGRFRTKKNGTSSENQNSKTTFIVQTFPKYGPYDFYLVNLSLLGAILAIFQFCGFSGLFWPFFPCK